MTRITPEAVVEAARALPELLGKPVIFNDAIYLRSNGECEVCALGAVYARAQLAAGQPYFTHEDSDGIKTIINTDIEQALSITSAYRYGVDSGFMRYEADWEEAASNLGLVYWSAEDGSYTEPEDEADYLDGYADGLAARAAVAAADLQRTWT